MTFSDRGIMAILDRVMRTPPGRLAGITVAEMEMIFSSMVVSHEDRRRWWYHRRRPRAYELLGVPIIVLDLPPNPSTRADSLLLDPDPFGYVTGGY